MGIAATRADLVDLTCQLAREYDGVLAAGSVIRCVTRCRDELMLMGVRDGLLPAVEAMARRRLRGRLMGLSRPVLQAVGT